MVPQSVWHRAWVLSEKSANRAKSDFRSQSREETYRGTLVLLVSAFYAALIVIYNFQVNQDVRLAAINIEQIEILASARELVAGYLLSIVPFAVYRSRGKISDVVYMYLLLAVYVPGVLFLMTYPGMATGMRYLNVAWLGASMALLSTVRHVPRLYLGDSGRHRYAARMLLVAVAVGGTVYFMAFESSSLDDVRFIDVYARRLEIRDAIQAGAGRFNVYLSNLMGLAIAPFLAVWGLRHKSWWRLAAGLGVAYVAFAVSSHKYVFFSTVIALTFVIAPMAVPKWQSPARFPLAVAIVAIIGFNIVPFLGDYWFMNLPLLSWYGSFRLFINNGYLLAVYIDYFGDKPFLLYADSFLARFVSSPFDMPFGEVIGEYISIIPNSQNNATASFLSDGYVNLGYAGMLFAALQAWLVLWIADSMLRSRDIVFAGAIVIPLALAFANGPVHTTLVGNGGLAVLLLLALVPDTPKPRTVGQATTPFKPGGLASTQVPPRPPSHKTVADPSKPEPVAGD